LPLLVAIALGCPLLLYPYIFLKEKMKKKKAIWNCGVGNGDKVFG
tara:strand:- start:1469 stop:1603 length:135 start_codon:yes stop_codon:yes gene_type:complete